MLYIYKRFLEPESFGKPTSLHLNTTNIVNPSHSFTNEPSGHGDILQTLKRFRIRGGKSINQLIDQQQSGFRLFSSLTLHR